MMHGLASKTARPAIAAVRTWWAPRRSVLIRAALVLLGLYAAAKLGTELHRLLFVPSRMGAIDLKYIHFEVHTWFSGGRVYETLPTAVYPPASYVLFWPLLGWTSVETARWIWAAISLAGLAALSAMLVHVSSARQPETKALVAMLPFSLNATGVGLGNGQLPPLVMPLIVGGVILVDRYQRGWPTDAWAACLLIGALLKPSMSAPFIWFALLTSRSTRVLLLVGAIYTMLTLFGASWQEGSVQEQVHQWLANSAPISGRGYANLHSWLGVLGLESWKPAASGLVWIGLGFWLVRHRHTPLWLRLGVTALAARLWAHHRVYDDMLILLPMTALVAVAGSRPADADDGRDVWAGVLLALTIVVMMIPARFGGPESPWLFLYSTTHAVLWLILLAFLGRTARRPQVAESSSGRV